MTRCLSWSFLPSLEMTAGGVSGRGYRTKGSDERVGHTVCEEYVEKAEMVRVVDVEDVVRARLAERGPVDDPAFAVSAAGVSRGRGRLRAWTC